MNCSNCKQIINYVNCCPVFSLLDNSFRTFSIYSGQFPERTNILFILDFEINNPIFINFITKLLKGVSLVKYRISFASTIGVSQDTFHYKSRQCLINKLKQSQIDNQLLLTQVVSDASDKHFQNFPFDKKLLVTITSKALDQSVQNILGSYIKRQTSRGLYSIVFDEEINAISVTILRKGQQSAEIVENIKTDDDVFKELPFYNGDLKKCTPSKIPVYDECQRECQCINNELKNCYRVRKQFSSLPLEERQYYIDSYKELASGKTYARRYYEYMMIHVKNFKRLHAAPMLLTWHRRFIYETENLLRLMDCRITIPYWNFPLHENTTFKPTPNHHLWDDIGGLGSPHTKIDNGYCVETGDFRQNHWKTLRTPKWFLDEYIYSVCYDRFYSTIKKDTKAADVCVFTFQRTFRQKCVMRNPGCLQVMPSYKRIYDVIKTFTADQFTEFERIFREEWHIVMHNCIGGNMGTAISNYSPEFWPFHSMIDAIWTQWQNKGKKYKDVLVHDQKTLLIGFNELRALYQDNDNLGGCGVKIKYTEIFPLQP